MVTTQCFFAKKFYNNSMFCNREEHTVKGNFYTKLQTHTNYLIHDSNSTSEL